MEYTICIEKNEDGWLTGQCEQFPQAISQGKDIDDLMENMKDAIELVLEVKRDEYSFLQRIEYYYNLNHI